MKLISTNLNLVTTAPWIIGSFSKHDGNLNGASFETKELFIQNKENE